MAQKTKHAAKFWTCPDCRIAVEVRHECWRCGNPERPPMVTCDACGWHGPAGNLGRCAGCGNSAVRQPTFREKEVW